VAKDLVDQLQQSVGIVAIFLMNFTGEPVSMIHYGIFMVATVQHHTARKNYKAGEENEQNFQTLFASIHKVTVEHVTISVRW
jgi:hypothetical protein